MRTLAFEVISQSETLPSMLTHALPKCQHGWSVYWIIFWPDYLSPTNCSTDFLICHLQAQHAGSMSRHGNGSGSWEPHSKQYIGKTELLPADMTHKFNQRTSTEARLVSADYCVQPMWTKKSTNEPTTLRKYGHFVTIQPGSWTILDFPQVCSSITQCVCVK